MVNASVWTLCRKNRPRIAQKDFCLECVHNKTRSEKGRWLVGVGEYEMRRGERPVMGTQSWGHGDILQSEYDVVIQLLR